MEKNFSIDFQNNLSIIIENQIKKILDEKIETLLLEKINNIIDDIKQQSINIINESDISHAEKQKIIDNYNTKIMKKINTEWDIFQKINLLSDNIKIRDIDKLLNENGVNFSKRKFLYYIEQGLIPKASEKISKNQALYSKTHILMYILISFFEEQLEIDKIKEVLEFFSPLIAEIGLDEFVDFAYGIQRTIDKDFIANYSDAIISSSEYLMDNVPDSDTTSKLMLYSANMISSTIMSKKYGEILDHLLNQYKKN